MKLREDQLRLQGLLKETITLLCKNGLQFKNKFCVEALIGITTDESDVFLVNIKEKVRNDGATGDSDNDFDVSVHRDSNESDDPRHKSNRKRPPDQGDNSDVSPTKRTRSYDDDQDYSDDDEVSNMSANETANVKREPKDDGELVFVKEEMNYDSTAHQQSFDMSQFGHQPGGANFSANDPGFDSSRDGSTSGMGWSQTGLDVSQSTPQGGSQQMLSNRPPEPDSVICQLCHLYFDNLQTLNDHYNVVHTETKAKGEFVCSVCDKDFTRKPSLVSHQFKMHGIGQLPVKCGLCDARFANWAKKKRHMKDHHPEQIDQ